MSDRYIHIHNFGRFQRFQDRRPRWIRLHLDLIDNDAYLALTDHQQAVLITLWITYARRVREDAEGLFTDCRGLPESTARLSRLTGRRILSRTIEALNHAGFLDILETESVTIRAGFGSPEVRDLDKNNAREDRSTPVTGQERSRSPFQAPEGTKQMQRAVAFTRNVGHEYERTSYAEELERMSLDPDEEQQLWVLWDELRAKTATAEPAPVILPPVSMNGAAPEDELPWEGEEPPVLAE